MTSHKTEHRLQKASTLIAALKEVMRELGYSIQSPAQLGGTSGAVHTFDIYASSIKGETVAVEIDDQQRPKELSILALYAKTIDTNPSRTIFITTNNIDQQARRLAELYRIDLLSEPSTPQEIRRQLQTILHKNGTRDDRNRIAHS